MAPINSLRQRQNGHLFADDTFKCIFLNENIRISTKNSLKFVPKGLIKNIPVLVLIMAWRRPGDKPLSEPMQVRSLTHICVTQPQWVNTLMCNHILQGKPCCTNHLRFSLHELQNKSCIISDLIINIKIKNAINQDCSSLINVWSSQGLLLLHQSPINYKHYQWFHEDLLIQNVSFIPRLNDAHNLSGNSDS